MSSTGTAGIDHLIRVRPPEDSPRPEPTWDDAEVVAHDLIGGRYHRLVLHTPSIATRAKAGQFVMISVPGMILPRPMAIHRRHRDSGDIEVIFNIVGLGTEKLAASTPGNSLLLTGPLGRGFEIPDGDGDALVIGRGIGVCAVMGVAEDGRTTGIPVTAVLSAATRASVIGEGDIGQLGASSIIVSDDDGSSTPANVETLLRGRFDQRPPRVIMACGSARLIRMAVDLGRTWDAPVQVSLEAHMACGLGYCHGCAAPIITDSRSEGPLVCVDGPVFDAGVPEMH